MSTDNNLICFKAISNFTNELVDHFSKNQRSLKLYGRLINKTTITHNESIEKHISAFRAFCIANRDAIFSKNKGKIVVTKIEYSPRVLIDMTNIFHHADSDTINVIWDHLLTISALVDPAGKAKEVLKENLAAGKTGGNETDFITNIIDKVESHVNPNSNPMEAVSAIMKSGLFTDLIGGMNSGLSNGSLDLSKLMGAVQGMIGKLGDKAGENKNDQTMNMITSLMGNMGSISGMDGGNGNGAPPNIAGLMQGMQGMLQGMGSINTSSLSSLSSSSSSSSLSSSSSSSSSSSLSSSDNPLSSPSKIDVLD